MRTIDNFDHLSLSEKYQFIIDNGKYIGVRPYYNYSINLYLVDDNFVELWYFRDENSIERIEILEDISKLDLYINYMNHIEQTKGSK